MTRVNDSVMVIMGMNFGPARNAIKMTTIEMNPVSQTTIDSQPENLKYASFFLLGLMTFWSVLFLPGQIAVLGMMLLIWFSESKSNHWFTWVAVTIAPFLFMALLQHVVKFPAMYNVLVLTVFVLFAVEANKHLMIFSDKMIGIE